jgi:hypothetical protein
MGEQYGGMTDLSQFLPAFGERMMSRAGPRYILSTKKSGRTLDVVYAIRFIETGVTTYLTPLPLNSSPSAMPLRFISRLEKVAAVLIPVGKPVTF